jgi:hypothetical protein
MTGSSSAVRPFHTSSSTQRQPWIRALEDKPADHVKTQRLHLNILGNDQGIRGIVSFSFYITVATISKSINRINILRVNILLRVNNNFVEPVN